MNLATIVGLTVILVFVSLGILALVVKSWRKYLLLVAAGLGELLLISSVVIVLLAYVSSPLAWFLAIILFAHYVKTGGIDNWSPTNIDRKSTRLNSSHSSISY